MESQLETLISTLEWPLTVYGILLDGPTRFMEIQSLLVRTNKDVGKRMSSRMV
jgi:hypothetical protein